MNDAIRSIPLSQRVLAVDSKRDVTDHPRRCMALFAPLRVLFLNGYGARPGGVHSTLLRVLGHTVVEPDLPGHNFARSVALAQRVFNRHHPDVVVGWSRGGAVAMSIDVKHASRILMAPAWKHWGTMATVKPEVAILHSPQDELVPIDESRELLRNSGLPERRLVAVGEGHRMIDEAAVLALLEAVESSGVGYKPRQAA